MDITEDCNIHETNQSDSNKRAIAPHLNATLSRTRFKICFVYHLRLPHPRQELQRMEKSLRLISALPRLSFDGKVSYNKCCVLTARPEATSSTSHRRGGPTCLALKVRIQVTLRRNDGT